jgi:hypothetical protein
MALQGDRGELGRRMDQTLEDLLAGAEREYDFDASIKVPSAPHHRYKIIGIIAQEERLTLKSQAALQTDPEAILEYVSTGYFAMRANGGWV